MNKTEYMKLPEFAQKIKVSYRTALRYFQNGLIPGGFRLPSGAIRIPKDAVKRIVRRGEGVKVGHPKPYKRDSRDYLEKRG